MKTKLLAICLGISTLVSTLPALAQESILQRIQRTGELRVGVRELAIPMTFKNQRGQYTGFAYGIVQNLQRGLRTKAGRPVKIVNVPVTGSEDVFQKIEQGKIDIECGSTSLTKERLQRVDFSVPYFVTVTQFLLRPGDSINLNDLSGKKIAVVNKTTTEEFLKAKYPNATIVPVKNSRELLRALDQKQVDTVSADSIILHGLLTRPENKAKKYQILPKDDDIALLLGGYEPFACVIPKGQTDWKERVDQTVDTIVQSILRSPKASLYKIWFGPRGFYPYPHQQYKGLYDLYQKNGPL